MPVQNRAATPTCSRLTPSRTIRTDSFSCSEMEGIIEFPVGLGLGEEVMILVSLLLNSGPVSVCLLAAVGVIVGLGLMAK